MVLVAAAPVFWRQVELRQGSIAQAHENAALYQGVYPAFHYGFQRLREGTVPLWNPNQLCGAPVLADPAVGLFQPLNAVFLALPTERAMAAHAFMCLSLMGFFFVLFARSLGVRYIPALAGGVAYAFCGASAAAMSHPPLANALVWTPCLFWGLREYARGWHVGWAVLTGLAGAMLVLSGSPALVVAVLCLWAPYRLYLTFLGDSAGQGRARDRVIGLVVMGIVALAVSAVQWLPTLAWALTLDQPAAALWRLNLAGLVPANGRGVLGQLLAAKPDALPHVAYVGVTALLAIPAVLFRRTGRRDAAFFLVAAPLCLAVTGAAGEGLPWSFPRGAFAVPGALSLAVLAALGLDRLLVPAREPRAPGVSGPALAVLIVAGAVFYASTAEARGPVIAFLAILAPFLVVRSRAAAVIGGLAFVLLLFAEVTLASVNRYRHPLEDAPQCYHRYAATVVSAQEQALGKRLLVSAHPLDPALPGNLGMVFPVAVAGGSRIPLTRAQARWWARLSSSEDATAAAAGGLTTTAVGSPLVDLMAVRAIVAAPGGALFEEDWMMDAGRFRPVRTEDEARLVVNEDAFPRAYFVPAWRSAGSLEAALDMVSAPDFDGTAACVVLAGDPAFEALTALVPREPSAATDADADRAPGMCTIKAASPERVVLHVETAAPGVTVLADTFDRGWRAAVNGIAWPILQTNGLFRGVAVPAGTHEIVFEYRPLPFTLGLTISLGGLALLVLLGLVGIGRLR